MLSIISEPLGLPKKSVTYLIIILLIGFPIYIYYVWKFKLLKYEIEQTEDPNTPYNKSAFQKMYFSSLFVIGLLSGISIALIINNNFENKLTLNKMEGNNKIAVLNFDNNTKDEKLNNVGKIASTWISHGISMNEVAQVISPKLINDYTSLIKSQSNSTDDNELLTTYFKPGKIIEGAFYKENDTLLLQGSIKDGISNETLISFETIKCDPNSPLDCAEKLKQQINGYLTTEGNQHEAGYIKNKDNQTVSYYEEKPPNYTAYEFLKNALAYLNNDEKHLELLNKAIENDPDFFEPKIHLIAHYYNKGDFKTADSLRKNSITNSKLTIRQKNWMLFYESILNGKNNKTYRAIKEEYKLAYKDISTNMTAMTIALQYVNRPEDIEAIYNEIPMDDMILENCSRCGARYYLKGLADVELGNYPEVIKTLVPITNIIEANYLKRPLINAYVKSNKLNELENYLSHYALSASKNAMDYLNMFTAIQLINASKTEAANRYLNKIISNKTTTNPSYLAQAYFYKNDFSNAKTIYKKLLADKPKNIEYTVQLAICYYKTGNLETAKTTINKLDALKTNFQFGAVDYAWAQYHNATKNKDKALEFLLKAVAQGYNFTPLTFQNDPHFKTIKDSIEFKNRIMNYWKNKAL